MLSELSDINNVSNVLVMSIKAIKTYKKVLSNSKFDTNKDKEIFFVSMF